MLSPETAKRASTGGLPARSPSVSKNATAAGPEIESRFAPSCGSASSAARRCRESRHCRVAPRRTTGARERQARPPGDGDEHRPRHGRRRRDDRKRDGPAGPLERAERADDGPRGRLAIESPAGLVRRDLDLEPAPDDRRVRRLPVDALGHALEREVQRRIRDPDAREDLRPEEARVQPPVAANRAEPVSGPCRRFDRSTPVGIDAELVGREGVRLAPRREGDRLGADGGEPLFELRLRLPRGQPSDVDAGHVRPGGKLLPGAGEREPEENAEQQEEHDPERERRDSGPAGAALTSRTRREER